ncbi:ribonuclease 3-like protein 2 isoform X1 [Henckelia pumila]|uniref:ribonuclease 3-like protein 2 isoform X1 n=1 Tax=Henckelia pumila TaxID=405737 RepID=UPI003C6E713D
MQSQPSNYTYSYPPEEADEYQEIPDIATSVRLVENLLNYSFKNKELLEEALTHSSYTESPSYQRLEFLGDSALGLAISSYLFIAYPDLDPGKLSLIRAANISTEKLARIAVRHQLYKYIRHNAANLDKKVGDFVIAVQQEEGSEVHGGFIKAPKILADIVESVAAAVYVDCNFNSNDMWVIIRDLLEPMITLDMLEQKPQPVTTLFEQCQKDGKQVDIKHWRNGDRNIASVYVDGRFVASASSEQKENAKLHAAKFALQRLPCESSDMKVVNASCSQLNGNNEIEGAKHKLHELCAKKKWPKPNYKIQEEIGLSHKKKYICSVEIEITEGILFMKGNEKSKLKEAENSAASAMLLGLQESKYL